MNICRGLPLILVSLLLAALSSCSSLSSIDNNGNVTIRRPSLLMKAQGEIEFAHLKRTKKQSSDPRFTAPVQRVSKRLCKAIGAKESDWEFVVFKDKTPNAFALPGGKVGVNTGLFRITDNDALLAAVIGHEMSHATSAHASQRMLRTLAAVIGGAVVWRAADQHDVSPELAVVGYTGMVYLLDSLPMSRRQEFESDRIGSIFMAKAGYDPRQTINLWNRLSDHHQTHPPRKHALLRTHPPDAERIKALQQFMPTALRHYRKHTQPRE